MILDSHGKPVPLARRAIGFTDRVLPLDSDATTDNVTPPRNVPHDGNWHGPLTWGDGYYQDPFAKGGR